MRNAAVRLHERMVLVMKRVVAIAACGLSLAACSSMPSWMQFDLGKVAPTATTMQFESEPAGADFMKLGVSNCIQLGMLEQAARLIPQAAIATTRFMTNTIHSLGPNGAALQVTQLRR